MHPAMNVKTLSISCVLLMDFLRNPAPPGLTAEGLPPDAVVVDARFDKINGDTLRLLVASSEFDDQGGDFTVLFHQSYDARFRPADLTVTIGDPLEGRVPVKVEFLVGRGADGVTEQELQQKTTALIAEITRRLKKG